jgi:hypothetical protein
MEIAERFRFDKRTQDVSESICNYVAELTKSTMHCNFGGHLEEALRDKLVCGMKNEQIQMEITIAMETATHDTLELQGGTCIQKNSTVH